MIGMNEWLIIAAVCVFLFGSKKVITWARSLGEAKREFQKSSEVKREFQKAEEKKQPVINR